MGNLIGLGENVTLEEHAEAWWREQGKEVPPSGTLEHEEMFEEWSNFVFGPE